MRQIRRNLSERGFGGVLPYVGEDPPSYGGSVSQKMAYFISVSLKTAGTSDSYRVKYDRIFESREGAIFK